MKPYVECPCCLCPLEGLDKKLMRLEYCAGSECPVTFQQSLSKSNELLSVSYDVGPYKVRITTYEMWRGMRIFQMDTYEIVSTRVLSVPHFTLPTVEDFKDLPALKNKIETWICFQ